MNPLSNTLPSDNSRAHNVRPDIFRATGLVGLAAALIATFAVAVPAHAQVPPPGTNPFYQQQPRQVQVPPVRQGFEIEQYQSLGRRNMAEGNIGQAEVRFEEALEINPFDPVALNNLASARAEQGDYHSALDMLERAQRLDENNLTIQANLARLRGWVNYYAGNELHPSQRIVVPEDQLSGGLPPAPPPLWDPRAGQQQMVIPTNPVGSPQGTFRGNEYLFVEPGNVAPATQVYDGAYINRYQSQAQGAVYGQQVQPQYSVPQVEQPVYVQPQYDYSGQ